MTIPPHLLDAVRRHQKAGRRAGLIVRHAERFPVLDLHTHEAVLLTKRGHEQAREAGEHLADLSASVKVLHSPVERCAETARALVEGAQSAGAKAEIVSPLDALYSPFIKDRPRAFDLVTSIGPRFIRDWFDGKLPPEVFEARDTAARGQIDVVAHHIHAHDLKTLTVFVSHDWNIALVREDVLGISPERQWPGFLDGVAVAVDEVDVMIELEGRIGTRKR